MCQALRLLLDWRRGDWPLANGTRGETCGAGAVGLPLLGPATAASMSCSGAPGVFEGDLSRLIRCSVGIPSTW